MDKSDKVLKKLYLCSLSQNHSGAAPPPPASSWSPCMPSLLKLRPQVIPAGDDRSLEWLEGIKELMKPNGEEKPSTEEMGQSIVGLRLPGALLNELDKRAGECNLSRDDFVRRAIGLALWVGGKKQQKVIYRVAELIYSSMPKMREVFWSIISQLEAELQDKIAEARNAGDVAQRD